MKKIIYYILLMVTLAGVFQSCEKGEMVDNYTPFTILLVQNFPNGYKLEIDGNRYAFGTNKVPFIEGQNVVNLFNNDDEMIFEGKFDLKPDRDTLLFFEFDENVPAVLMRRASLEAPQEEGKLKLKIITHLYT